MPLNVRAHSFSSGKDLVLFIFAASTFLNRRLLELGFSSFFITACATM